MAWQLGKLPPAEAMTIKTVRAETWADVPLSKRNADQAWSWDGRVVTFALGSTVRPYILTLVESHARG